MRTRLDYYRRVFRAYLAPGQSQLSFWHDSAQPNPRAPLNSLGEYYMGFQEKAHYPGPHDRDGIPMLDYRGKIGKQYNPIAVAQWGLGNFNSFQRSGNLHSRLNFLLAGDWLCRHLQPNRHGIHVWHHHFDWEYRETLRAPWYSGLAQGQGISMLVRAYLDTGNKKYLSAAELAFQSFLVELPAGGVCHTDNDGNIWIEEYIVSRPTHILNGFIWAAWGIYDYFLATGSKQAVSLFADCVRTLCRNLKRYDLGFWSRYELSNTFLPMIASRFYHRLHITQLRIMHQITREPGFAEYAGRWEAYTRSRAKRTRALWQKGAFKLCYY
ncbi:MAG TPA: D-glucuronyl C5-epimerase family protein [Terriglobales bacterium]